MITDARDAGSNYYQAKCLTGDYEHYDVMTKHAIPDEA